MSKTLAELDIVVVTVEYGDKASPCMPTEVIYGNKLSEENVKAFLHTSLTFRLGEALFNEVNWDSLHIER